MLGVSSLLRVVWSGASPSNFSADDNNKNNHDFSAGQTSSTPTLNATVTSIMDLLSGIMLKNTDTTSTPSSRPHTMPDNDAIAKVDSNSPSHIDETPDPNSQTVLLFTLPAELRNRIYAFATSYPGKITIKTLPPLAQVSKQLRHEVLPTFHDHNTFILTSPADLKDWHPCRGPASLAQLNKIHIDLKSSVAFGWTLRRYGLQPVKVLDEREEGEEEEEADEKDPCRDLTVVWASHQRGMTLLAESGLGVSLSIGYLTEELYHGVHFPTK